MIPTGTGMAFNFSGSLGSRPAHTLVSLPLAAGKITVQPAVSHERVVLVTDTGGMMAYHVPG